MSKRKQPPQAPSVPPRDEDWPDESEGCGTGVSPVPAPAGRRCHSAVESRPRRRPSIDVLHHDDDLIIVDKPSGTGIEAGFEDDFSVFEQLVRRGLASDEPDALHIVCPLDAEASGLLLLTRRGEAARFIRQHLADGTLDLCYLALVRGRITSRSGTIDRRVSPPVAERPPRIDDQRGQAAVTDWNLRDGFVGYSLLECRPRTAVPGQIRVHLGASGMPPAVDRLCGGAAELRLSSFKADYHPSRKRGERPLIARLTLHALSVRLPHPTTGVELRFEAPLPKDFRAALHQLNKYGRLPPG